MKTNFEFKVIARSATAICLVASILFFLLSKNSLGGLFLFLGVIFFFAPYISKWLQ
jgi:hypothetical protein